MKLIFKNKYQTFLTILFLFLISCSDQVENNLTANEIITNSSSRVSEWNSFRFSLEHEEGLTSLVVLINSNLQGEKSYYQEELV